MDLLPTLRAMIVVVGFCILAGLLAGFVAYILTRGLQRNPYTLTLRDVARFTFRGYNAVLISRAFCRMRDSGIDITVNQVENAYVSFRSVIGSPDDLVARLEQLQKGTEANNH